MTRLYLLALQLESNVVKKQVSQNFQHDHQAQAQEDHICQEVKYGIFVLVLNIYQESL